MHRIRRVASRVRRAPAAAMLGITAVPVLHVMLRRGWLKSSTVVDAVERRAPAKREVNAAQARHISAAVEIGVYLWRLKDSSCVARSLVTWAISARSGIDADVIIGFDPAAENAHAWVEVGGEPVNDTADVRQRFLAFDGALSDRDERGFGE